MLIGGIFELISTMRHERERGAKINVCVSRKSAVSFSAEVLHSAIRDPFFIFVCFQDGEK
jgi:hypothetical protein